ncbi:MAG: hypothetical protein MJY73_01985 [Bacteroidales bacterium]|nr:hypothetical protein [Bacteroidales bacterium]
MYLQVILPLKLNWAPTYKADAQIFRGQRVRVIFARKEYVGVVSRTDVQPDLAPAKILSIISVEERLPVISEAELRLWEFIAGYYLCTIGEVYKAAYPSMKLHSEEVVAATEARKEASRLRKLEVMQARVSRLEIRLKAKEAAIIEKKEGTKVRAELEAAREKTVLELDAAKKAVEAFLAQDESEDAPIIEKAPKPVPGKPMLLQGNMQSRAAEYSQIIREALGRGGQVLVLTPEKALCSALAGKLDGSILVMPCNSDCTAAQRRKVADTLRSGFPTAVLGNRSCIFLPFSNLQLIIIDEEQDSSYKQTEPAPRYNGRDCALALGSIHSAQVVLGSASPSLETELNVIGGKFTRRTLDTMTVAPEAFYDVDEDLPLEIIDIPAERRKRGMVGALSRKLIGRVNRSKGTAVFIRGWENAEEIQAQCNELFGSGKVKVMSLPELKRSAPSDIELLAVLQADAFLSKDDFRSDEKALQLVAMLQNFSAEVVIQTAVSDRFRGTRSMQELLKERKDFSLPPYSRAVEVILQDNDEVRKQHMLRILSGACPAPIVMPDRIRWNLPRGTKLQGSKSAIAAAVAGLESKEKYIGHIIIDVDPA